MIGSLEEVCVREDKPLLLMQIGARGGLLPPWVRREIGVEEDDVRALQWDVVKDVVREVMPRGHLRGVGVWRFACDEEDRRGNRGDLAIQGERVRGAVKRVWDGL